MKNEVRRQVSKYIATACFTTQIKAKNGEQPLADNIGSLGYALDQATFFFSGNSGSMWQWPKTLELIQDWVSINVKFIDGVFVLLKLERLYEGLFICTRF